MTPDVRPVEALELSARRQNRSALTSALTQLDGVRFAISTTDPYGENFADDLERNLRAALAGYWPRVRAALPTLPDESVLRHAWASATSSPLQMAALYRSVLDTDQAGLSELLESLLASTGRAIFGDALANAVVALPAVPPDLGGDDRLMPGMRLRYALAARFRRHAKTSELLACAQSSRAASPYVRRRELLRLVGMSSLAGRRLKPLDVVEFILMPDPQQDLLVSSQGLIDALLHASLRGEKDLRAWLEGARRQRAQRLKQAERLALALEARDFSAAAKRLEPMDVEPLTRGVLTLAMGGHRSEAPSDEPSDAAAESRSDRAAPRSSRSRRWTPLSGAAMEKLKRLQPRRQFPPHWVWAAKEIAEAIASERIDSGRVRAMEWRLLRRSWGLSAERLLIEAGKQSALDDTASVWAQLPFAHLQEVAGNRPDFKSILSRKLAGKLDVHDLLVALAAEGGEALRGQVSAALRQGHSGQRLGQLVRPWIGSSLWIQAGAWDIHLPSLQEDLLELADAPIQAVDTDGFRLAVVEALLQGLAAARRVRRSGKVPKPSSPELAAKLLRCDLDLLPVLAAHASLDWMRALVGAINEDGAALQRLYEVGPSDLRPAVYGARLRNARTASETLSLLGEGARGNFPADWDARWLRFAKDPETRSVEGLASIVLALRHDFKRLRRAVAGVPPDEMRPALERAVAELAGAPGRDRAVLELVREVGVDVAPHLAAALGQCRRDAEPGHRLDHAYKRWKLPKKSGGTREISVPPPSLMRVQRALLATFLNPLGVHPAAFGFAKGRSIRGNALPHVGQAVVANADVANCFPSVRWPLVLAALRRDLGGRLSPTAIGLLVDLCTSDGGLPIGAPTSPALLNRVLLKTDEILVAAAAKRDCVYTRYADDLTFSGDHGAVELLGVAKGTLGRIGLELDPKKTNIFRKGRRQICTGLVVNERVSVPRRIRRRLRAAVHAAEAGRGTTWHGQPQSPESLRGRLSFLHMIHAEEGERLSQRLKVALEEPKPKPRRRGKAER